VTVDLLRDSYHSLKKQAAPGVDGVTWEEYGQTLEARLSDLHGRIHRGAYRAKPSRRVWIPKGDGRQRPLGIVALEDKVVQYAVGKVLNQIWEEDFLGFSYGFRPGRSQHDALDALNVGIARKKVNWVLDLDIRAYFDRIDHSWMIKFVEHRIGDRRIVRLIQKWLKAGVMEQGRWFEAEEGTPQGAVISPILANLYLHYVLDLWVDQWRRKEATGDVIIVRYADDAVLGFQHRDEAVRFLEQLRERLGKFGLELHPEKTRCNAPRCFPQKFSRYFPADFSESIHYPRAASGREWDRILACVGINRYPGGTHSEAPSKTGRAHFAFYSPGPPLGSSPKKCRCLLFCSFKESPSRARIRTREG
jgi:group II intron reverse transcriptase/maturase